MLQRLLILRKAIMGQVTKEEHILLPNEWNLMQQVADVLEPIKAISETLTATKYPTMSLTFPAVMELLNVKLNEEKKPSPNATIAEFKKVMRANLFDHFNDLTQRNIMEVCSFMDPR